MAESAPLPNYMNLMPWCRSCRDGVEHDYHDEPTNPSEVPVAITTGEHVEPDAPKETGISTSVRLSRSIIDRVQVRAEAEHRSTSSWIRHVILSALEDE